MPMRPFLLRATSIMALIALSVALADGVARRELRQATDDVTSSTIAAVKQTAGTSDE